MSNLRKAVQLSANEWAEEIEQGMKEAEARGELPHKTPEELKAEAQEIWNKTHP